MSNVELLFSTAGVMVAIAAGIVVPIVSRFGGWMGAVTEALSDIRVHQGRHDERLERNESDVEEIKAVVYGHESRIHSLESGT